MMKPRRRIFRFALILAILLAAMSVTALASSSEGTHEAYYYILKPGYGTSPTHNTGHYEFMGRGSVSAALGSTDEVQTIAVTPENSGYITAPTPDESQSFSGGTAGSVTDRLTYPAVEFEGSTYYYEGSSAAAESGPSYDIVWYRYSCSEGFNIGTNSFYGGNKWHVDGYLTLSDKASVTYKVQFPGSDEFVLVNAAGTAGGVVFVDYVDNGTEFSEVDQPSVAMSRNGCSFSDWYYDEACTQPVYGGDEISGDVTLYGKYEAAESGGTGEVYIEVYLDGERLELTAENKSEVFEKYLTVYEEDGLTFVGAEDGKLKYSFVKNGFDATAVKVAEGKNGIVIQGVCGSFIYGNNGWTDPYDEYIFPRHFTVYENVKGGSTLTFYLNTLYMSFYYYIDTAQAQQPFQGYSYVTVKMIDHAVPADFGSTTPNSPLADRSAARHATWMNSWELRTELHAGYYWGTMNEIREGYTGWYTTESGEVMHAYVISGNDLKAAAESSGALYTPYTIEFYALKNFGAMDISKSVYSINGELVTGEIGEIEVGDRIVYKIVLANTGNVLLNSSNKSIKDMMGDTELLLYTDPECDPDSSQRYYFRDIWPGGSETMYAAYTVTADDIGAALTNTVTATSDTLSATDTCTIEVEPEKDYSVTIAPADIVAYTGGRGYGSVVGGDGQLHDSVEGLPEPGYHISLSEDAIEWLAEQVGSIEPQDLSEYLAFTYDDGDVTRRWELEYMGIYESDAETGDPLRYVYRLNSTGGAPPVRLQYWDGSSYVFDDDIDMSETAVNASYTMSLYPGSLDQGLVKAVLTVGDESIEAEALAGTGTLTVLSTVNKDGNTTEIGGDAGAVDGGSVTAVGDAEYYVNDTEVPITDPDRVKLLVDEVSNSSEYVEAMAGDAMDTVMSEYGLDGAGCETFYLDLVDTENGNAKVTMGAGDSLKIYWPIPEQAGSSSRLYVVHYYGLDRTETDAGAELSAEPRHVQQADIEQVGGVRYAVFEVSSFSPFALVWEESVDSPLPITPPETPTEPSEPVYTPNWLNTTDHVSYIIGYSDGTVKPNAGITRAEVATIFFRLLTDGARERFWSETSAYSDVAAGSWYNIAVSTLSNMGILGGYEDGTFRPNASITRAEFAKIAVSFFDWADVYAVNSFVDVRDSAWYANYVAVAAEIGLIEGYGGNVFRPDATITRAEACTIINRTLGRAPDADHLLPVGQMNTWPDNSDTGVWYYAQIQEATNSHDYRWLGDIEQWTAKLTDPDWDKLQY
mgnify:CR=1 FL=1